MSWSTVRELLCVRLDSLGDVLMSTPAIRACKRSFGCRTTLLASCAGAAVAKLVPEIDDCVEFAAPWMKVAVPGADGALIAQLKERRFDAAVIFTVYSQSPLPAAYLCYLAGIPRRLAHCHENPYHLLTDWQPDPEPADKVRHEVQRQLDLVASVGARTTDSGLSFEVPAHSAHWIEHFIAGMPRPLVVVHPGASAASRRYPPEQYARAVDLLIGETGCTVIFTGDAAEDALIRVVQQGMASATLSLAGALSLGRLGALIAEADLLISNNTGPVHVAAALGTPVVDLYALTNPQHTPWQVASRVLFHDVPCRNCYRSICPTGHHDCLRRVSPESVAAAASELLAA
jgi:lipopolysaccharide heptosyltransferase II